MVEVTIATTENQMDPHAVMPALNERGRKSERENERGHIHHHHHHLHYHHHHTIVTVLTTAATYMPPPFAVRLSS